ncbi:hypothetical protein MRX96_044102 [Rhipicephalus microplus]
MSIDNPTLTIASSLSVITPTETSIPHPTRTCTTLGTSNDRFVLRSSSEYSTIVHHVKLKTQRPAVRRAMSPIWLVNSSGLIEHQTMYQQHQQQMSRCEELCSLMGTVSLGTDSARQWSSRPARHTQSRTRPAAGPPLYPIHPRDRERTYLEETWLRRRLARVKCCLGHLDRTSRLQWTADSLEKEKTRIESALSDVHDELLRMTHVIVGSQTRSCHAHHSGNAEFIRERERRMELWKGRNPLLMLLRLILAQRDKPPARMRKKAQLQLVSEATAVATGPRGDPGSWIHARARVWEDEISRFCAGSTNRITASARNYIMKRSSR